MNFVLTMFFGGSGLLHILVTMKQHKSLVLTSQYRHATGTVLRQFSTTKLPTIMAHSCLKVLYHAVSPYTDLFILWLQTGVIKGVLPSTYAQ